MSGIHSAVVVRIRLIGLGKVVFALNRRTGLELEAGFYFEIHREPFGIQAFAFEFDNYFDN